MSITTYSKPLVTCYCDTDLVHSSDAVTGLIELADADEIELQFRLCDPNVSRRRGMWALWLTVSTNEYQEQGVCIDCHDAPYYYCPDALAACRLYYKSNLRQETYDAVPIQHRNKLRPFGPYLPCRPRHDRAQKLRWLGNAYTKLRHLLFVSTKKRPWHERLRRYYGELKRHKRYASRYVWCDYEARADSVSPGKPTILFNPSCWDETIDDEIRPMNEKRARLIVALRREFGVRFIGGFRNSSPSVANYPDAIEPRALSHDEYVRILQSSPLTVYVNGISACFSWRLAENFAAGKCMVSERIVNNAGFPLDESCGIVQCDSVEDIVESLKVLSESPERLQALAENSRNAYVERMRPPVRMRRILAELNNSTSESNPPIGDVPCAAGETSR